MSAKHTPGPWEVYTEITSQTTGCPVAEAGPGTFVEFGVQTAAEHCHLTDAISSPADARLIAASPDLLSALESLMEYADNGTPVHPGSLDWEQARAAIAKARGDK